MTINCTTLNTKRDPLWSDFWTSLKNILRFITNLLHIKITKYFHNRLIHVDCKLQDLYDMCYFI